MMSTSSTEISTNEGLNLLFASREKYSDLTLIGSDRVRVPAVRCLLACRSPVFDKMLYGEFVEAKSDEVELPYAGDILESLVSYACTNKVEEILDAEDATKQDGFVQKAVGLADAAAYFEFPLLHSKVTTVLCNVMKGNLSIVLDFLAASESFVSFHGSTIMDFAMEYICLNLDVLLLKGEMLSLMSASTMQRILESQDFMVDETSLFKLLDCWSRIESTDGNNTEREGRKPKAAELTKFVDLKSIETHDLTTMVAPSGLVSTEQLMEAYRFRACFADMHGKPFEGRRLPKDCVWESSKSTIFSGPIQINNNIEKLGVHPMRTGVFKWRIKVLEIGRKTRVGVVSSEHSLDSTGEPFCHGGWMYDCTGAAYPIAYLSYSYYEYTHSKYGKGDVVTLTLKVLDGRASLYASVNGGQTFELLSDMRSSVDGTGRLGFIPAVSLKHGKVEFLGFD